MNKLKITVLTVLLAGSAAVYAQEEQSVDEQAVPEKSVTMPEFRTLDINSDGQVSEQEAQSNAMVWESFVELDADKSGALSSEEYSSGKSMEESPKDTSDY